MGAGPSRGPPLDERTAATKLQAAARGRHARAPIVLGGKSYFFEQVLGTAFAWERKRGYVIVARATTGERVAIKQLMPNSYAQATLSIEAEVRVSRGLHAFAAAHGHPGNVHFPAFIAHDHYNAAAELVKDAEPLQRWLRAPRSLGDGAAEQDHAVCWVVVRKVATLLHALREVRFRHRDLHDGNVLIRINRRPVRTCDDVDVWLIDFGKAMVLMSADGQLSPSGALVSPSDAGGVSTVWNPSADTLRLCWSLQRSLLIAYGFTKADGWRDRGAAGGRLMFSLPTLASTEINDMFKAALPFAAHVGGWLDFVKSSAPAASAKGGGGGGDGHIMEARRYDTLIDFLCAGVEVKASVLTPYYHQQLPTGWYAKLLPEQLAAECPLPFPSEAATATTGGGAGLGAGLGAGSLVGSFKRSPSVVAEAPARMAATARGLVSGFFTRKSPAPMLATAAPAVQGKVA